MKIMEAFKKIMNEEGSCMEPLEALGQNAHIVVAFWALFDKGVPKISREWDSEWREARANCGRAAWYETAIGAVYTTRAAMSVVDGRDYRAWDALAGATNEIQGWGKKIDHAGTSRLNKCFFLPLFGIESPDSILIQNI